MRILTGLLALGLLGCQSASPPSTSSPQASQPAPVLPKQARSEIPPAPPRRPLARLNPRRQSLEVGEAPVRPAPPPRPYRPMKIGVQVVSAAPVVEPRVLPPSLRPASSLPVEGHTQNAPSSQVDELIAQQRERIQLQNQWLMNQQPRPGQNLTPQMQPIAYPQIAYPQIAYPQTGPSLAHQQAERRYLEARADFLNTKYLPPGSPLRYTPESVRGMVGTGMPLPPQMMTQPAMFNPVLQKAQQAEVLRQEMVRTP